MENLPINNGNGQAFGLTLYETIICTGGRLQAEVHDVAQVSKPLVLLLAQGSAGGQHHSLSVFLHSCKVLGTETYQRTYFLLYPSLDLLWPLGQPPAVCGESDTAFSQSCPPLLCLLTQVSLL